LSIFRNPHIKKEKIQKNQKLSEENQKINFNEKRTPGCPKNAQRFVEEV
jgi:hypothetical protein